MRRMMTTIIKHDSYFLTASMEAATIIAMFDSEESMARFFSFTGGLI